MGFKFNRLKILVIVRPGLFVLSELNIKIRKSQQNLGNSFLEVLVKTLPNDPVILGAYRSPLGKYGGVLSALRPDDMLASLLIETVDRTKIDAEEIDEVVIGCANQA